LLLKLGHDGARQHRYPILESFAIADQDLTAHEIDILYAQPHALHDAHASAVEKAADERVHAAEALEDASHLIRSEHDRQALGRPRALDPFKPRQIDAEHFLVQEEQRALGLVLRRPGDLPDHRQIREKGLDLGRA